MLCHMTRWMVSRALDTGRPLFSLAVRHLEQCGNCRDFARSFRSLETGLRTDAPEFLRGTGDPLEKKIIATLTKTAGSRAFPRRRYIPLPAIAAGLAIIAVAIAVLLQVGPGAMPDSNGNSIFASPGSIDTPTVLQDIMGRVETPIEAEIRSLEQSVKSAAGFLLASLELKLTDGGGETLPSTL